jgi:AcrR family transcriptional regulator
VATSRARPGRVALLRTAVALMGEKGYEGTSTRDIAGAAGVSVAALYYHFPSKLDLLREFLFDAHDIVLARLEREVAAAGPDARAQLDAAVEALVWSNLHDDFARSASRVAWQEHGRLDAPDRRAIAGKRQQMVAVIERIVRAGVEDGTFTTADPGEVAAAVLTLCIAVVDPFPDVRRPMAEVIELYQRFAAALACTAARQEA